MGKLRLCDEMVAPFDLALNVSPEGRPKDSLKVMRRMKALDGLPPDNLRSILDSLDLLIQPARDNRRDS